MFVLLLTIKILLYLLIFIIALALLFLIIPFEYEINAEIHEKILANVSLSFLKRILSVIVTYENKETLLLIKVMGLCILRKTPVQSGRKVKEKKLPEKKVAVNIMDYIQSEFLKDSINCLKNIINIIKPKRIKINGVYGFEDPSLTGLICGLIPLLSMLIPSSQINLQPVFDDETIDIYGEIYGKVSLFVVAIKALKFVLKKSNRKIIFKNSKKVETN